MVYFNRVNTVNEVNRTICCEKDFFQEDLL